MYCFEKGFFHFCEKVSYLIWILGYLRALIFISYGFFGYSRNSAYFPRRLTFESSKSPNPNYLKLTIKECTVFCTPHYCLSHANFLIFWYFFLLHTFGFIYCNFTFISSDNGWCIEQKHKFFKALWWTQLDLDIFCLPKSVIKTSKNKCCNKCPE